MYITDNEAKKSLVELEVANRKYVLTLYDRIIEVVKKFDGKVLNKRLENALKEIDDNLSANVEYGNSLYIKLYCRNDMVRGSSSCYYITNREIYLNSYAVTLDNKRDSNSIIVYDEKFNMRLNADTLIEKLVNRRKDIEKEIAEIEEKHSKVEEYEHTLETLREQITKTCNEIPAVIKDYYSLQYDVRRIY